MRPILTVLQMLLILVLTHFISTNAYAVLTMKGACTAEEKWSVSGEHPPEWIDKGVKFSSSNLKDLLLPYQRSLKNQGWSGASDYLAGRAYYQEGLIHLAFDRFQKIILTPEVSSKVLRVAAVQCLMKMQTDYATFKLSPAAIPFLSSHWKDDPHTYRNYFTLLMLRADIDSAQLPKEMMANASDQNAVKWILALKQATVSADEKTIQQLKSALNVPPEFSADPIVKPYLELLSLTLAREYYIAGKYQDSLAQSRLIAKQYPSLPENIELMAWTFFQLRNFNASNGQSLSLRTAGLKNYFAPQTSLIPAMVFLDHCQFEEAKSQLDYYRVKYRLEAAYLSKSTSDRYADLMATLLGKAKLVPAKIISEWLKSALVSSLLEENNMLVDERALIQKNREEMTRASGDHDLTPVIVNLVKADLQTLQKSLEEIEARNVTALRSMLNQKSETLKKQLDLATQNAGLMEVDILLALSNRISQTAHSKSISADEKETASDGKTPKAVWNWGKKVTIHLESEEVWADEMGNFRVPVKDQCRH